MKKIILVLALLFTSNEARVKADSPVYDPNHPNSYLCDGEWKEYSNINEAAEDCINATQNVIDCMIGEIKNKDSVKYSFGLHVALACAPNIPENISECLNAMTILKHEEVRTMNLFEPYWDILTENQKKILKYDNPDSERIREELRTGGKEAVAKLTKEFGGSGFTLEFFQACQDYIVADFVANDKWSECDILKASLGAADKEAMKKFRGLEVLMWTV